MDGGEGPPLLFSVDRYAHKHVNIIVRRQHCVDESNQRSGCIASFFGSQCSSSIGLNTIVLRIMTHSIRNRELCSVRCYVRDSRRYMAKACACSCVTLLVSVNSVKKLLSSVEVRGQNKSADSNQST